MQLGKVSRILFPEIDFLSPLAGEIFYVGGTMLALIMWGFGLVWFFFAIASISRSKFPFNMGWWGFTFPIGVFALATSTFGREFDSTIFKVLGTLLSVAVTVLWIGISLGTLRKSISGELFAAPCIKNTDSCQQDKDDKV